MNYSEISAEYETRTRKLNEKQLNQLEIAKRFVGDILPTDLVEGERYVLIRHNPKTDHATKLYFASITELVCCILKYRYYYHLYLAISTHTGDYLAVTATRRRCIAIDVEEEDLPPSREPEALWDHFFSRTGLTCHYIVMSGYGAHFYVLIEETSDIERVTQATLAINKRMSGDVSAINRAQKMRVPLSFNLKDGKKKLVYIAKEYACDRYTLEALWTLFDCVDRAEVTSQREPSAPNIEKGYACIRAMLERGAVKGERNFCLGRIAYFLHYVKGMEEDEALPIIRAWNDRCSPPKSEGELISQYHTWLDGDYQLLGCKAQNEHHNAVIKSYCTGCYTPKPKTTTTNFSPPEGTFVLWPEYATDELFGLLGGNDYLCLIVLLQSKAGFSFEELQTATGLGKVTLRRSLEGLQIEGLALCTDDIYTLKPRPKAKGFYFYPLALLDLVKTKKLSPNEFRLYLLLRRCCYDGKGACEVDLATVFDVPQSNISLYIHRLVKKGILGITKVRSDRSVHYYNLYDFPLENRDS